MRIVNYNMEMLSAEVLVDFQMVPGSGDGGGEAKTAYVGADSQDSFDASHHHG